MAETTWKQAVYDIADAYREAEGTTNKISIANLKEKVREGSGLPYTGPNPLTIGQDGYSFDPKTLLKDGLTIVNGVEGEDLTATEADMALAITELQRMVARKVSENRGEGQYVWKKYGDVPFEIIRQGTTSNPVIFNVTCESVDLSTVDLSWFDGATGTYDYGSGLGTFEIKNGSMHMDGSLRGTLTYNASTKQLTLAATVGSTQGWVCDKHTIFIDYVVSDDSTAYPNGGEQDGYWYELFEEADIASFLAPIWGYTKCAVDKVTFSSASQQPTLNHSLGTIPQLFMLVDAKPTSKADNSVTFMFARRTTDANYKYFSFVYTSSGIEYLNTTNYRYTPNSTQITLNNTMGGYQVRAGIEYTLITMA